MTAIVFTCPNLGAKVQHLVSDDEPLSDRQYQGLMCEACSRPHFVNRRGMVFRATVAHGDGPR